MKNISEDIKFSDDDIGGWEVSIAHGSSLLKFYRKATDARRIVDLNQAKQVSIGQSFGKREKYILDVDTINVGTFKLDDLRKLFDALGD
jgi:hypothetical protein